VPRSTTEPVGALRPCEGLVIGSFRMSAPPRIRVIAVTSVLVSVFQSRSPCVRPRRASLPTMELAATHDGYAALLLTSDMRNHRNRNNEVTFEVRKVSILT